MAVSALGCILGFGGVLPDTGSKWRLGNHIFSAGLFCAQEIQNIAFYFVIKGKCSSFPCFIRQGSSDHFQGLLQLLALAVLHGFSSRGETIFQYQRVF